CNLIGANLAGGITVASDLGRVASPTTGNRILGNQLGVGPNGEALGNGVAGITVRDGAHTTQIGSIWQPERDDICRAGCNRISHNPVGVLVIGADTHGVSIRGNRIYANERAEIDLGEDGISLNDPADADDGPNGMLNSPMSLAADFDGTTTISGVVNHQQPTSLTIDLYARFNTQEFEGGGDAERYLGTTRPDANGRFRLSYPGRLAWGSQTESRMPTAIATDAAGNSSEFATLTPIIFVPGVAGSVLLDRANNEELWIGQVTDALRPDFRRKLSLVYDQEHDLLGRNPQQVIAPDLLRVVTLAGVPASVIYGPFMDYLASKGYREYQTGNDPYRRTAAGCDLNQREANPPYLFAFPYDWRQDNAATAELLKEYMACVQQFFPGADVTVAAHSMGGLVTRRYVLDNPTSHQIGRFVSMGSPFLGSPKALGVLTTGSFVDLVADGEGIRYAAPSFKAPLQLATFPEYAAIAGRAAFREDGSWDYDGDGSYNEHYSYDEVVAALDKQFPQFQPGSMLRNFHTKPGQGDWRTLESGIRHFHIVGQQFQARTPIQAVATTKIGCTWLATICVPQAYRTVDLVLGAGDGTVALASATRQGGGQDLNAPEAHVIPIVSNRPADDSLVEHVFLPNNPVVADALLELTYGSFPRTGPLPARRASLNETASAASLADQAGGVTMRIYGTTPVISDSSGRSTNPGGDLRVNLPGVSQTTLGQQASLVALSGGQAYTLSMTSDGTPLLLELIIGPSEAPTRQVRFHDVILPAGRALQLHLDTSGAPRLLADQNGDGIPEQPIASTVDVSGAAAADLLPPEVRLQLSDGQVSLLALDVGSGVASLHYSLDGTRFQPYTTAFAAPSGARTVQVLVADHAGNRALRILPLAPVSRWPVFLPLVQR
ncbi:MAG: lipase/acyltransferase domain-containing protein, partial [Oscillochloridaceae bacterium umkhey_bin13]